MQAGSSQSTFKDVPKQVVSVFKRTSNNSILKTLERQYGLVKKGVQKTPLKLTLKPSERAKLKDFRDNCQDGRIARMMWDKLRGESYFRSSHDTWKVVLQIDYDELGQLIEHRDQHVEKDEADSESDDEEFDGDDDTSDDSEESDDETESDCKLDQFTKVLLFYYFFIFYKLMKVRRT